jgi:hypothetical protein
MNTTMEKDVPNKTALQNELALSKLRDAAVYGLLHEGRESTFTSAATATKEGLSVVTANDKTHQKDFFQVIGTDNERLRPAFSSSFPVGLGMSLSDDFKIVDGKNVENDKVKVATGINTSSKTLMSHDEGKLDITKTDSEGRQTQTAHADYDKFGHGHTANNTTEADWKIHDTKYGDVNINQVVTRQADGSTEYRGVMRDNDDRILGIVDQFFTTDKDGNIKSVSTEAHKSKFQGQVVHPTE